MNTTILILLFTILLYHICLKQIKLHLVSQMENLNATTYQYALLLQDGKPITKYIKSVIIAQKTVLDNIKVLNAWNILKTSSITDTDKKKANNFYNELSENLPSEINEQVEFFKSVMVYYTYADILYNIFPMSAAFIFSLIIKGLGHIVILPKSVAVNFNFNRVKDLRDEVIVLFMPRTRHKIATATYASAFSLVKATN